MTLDYLAHVGSHRFRSRRDPETGAVTLTPEPVSEPEKETGARAVADGLAASPASPPLHLEVDMAPGGEASDGQSFRTLRVGRRVLPLLATRDAEGGWTLELRGERHHAQVLDRGQEAVRAARKAAGAGAGLAPLRAPMPGLVVRVEVSPGDRVEAGQGVVIVEAMKMENELRAPAAARVTAVAVQAGVAVEKDAVLVEFGPIESEEEEG